MPDVIRSQAFWAITNDSGNVLEGDQEYVLNCIYFYDSLDKGMFDDQGTNIRTDSEEV